MKNPKRLLSFFLALSFFATQTAQAFSSLTWQPHTYRKVQRNTQSTETVQGTHLNAGGNVSLTALTAQATAQTPAPSSSNGVTDTRPQAVGDITLQSAHISSKGGAIAVQASGDVNLLGSDEQHHSYQQTRVASSGLLSSTTTTTRDETNRSLAVGSSLDGNSISIQSGKDINVVGSDVVATQNVTLNAGNNLNIIAAQNSQTSSTYKDQQTSGLYGNGGASVSLGKKQQTDTQTTTSTTHNASTVGSINGNVSLTAGNKEIGSDSN